MRSLRRQPAPDQAALVTQLKGEATRRAQLATATAYIFERRAKRYRRNLNWLTFVGVAVPVIIGGLVLSYGADFGPLGWAIPVAAVIGLVQLIYSVWSIVAGWVDRNDYAVRAVVTHRSLVQPYEILAKRETVDLSELRHQLDILKTIDSLQEETDYRQGVTDAEKRMGMRALLRQYQKECAACKKQPTDMKPTRGFWRDKCGVCDDYPARWVRG